MTKIQIQSGILHERKNWLNAMMGNIEEGLNTISLFNDIDEQYANEKLDAIEKDYQENLLYLRACHNNAIEVNAKDLGEIDFKQMIDKTSYNAN